MKQTYLGRIREVAGIMAGTIRTSSASSSERPTASPAPTPDRKLDASFSCRLARTQAEITLCNNESLIKLDRHLSLYYTQSFVHADPAERAMLQRTWEGFNSRRNACASESCLRDIYLARLDQVGKIVGAPAKRTQ